MRFAVGLARDNVEERLEMHGVSRRQFMKYCTAVAVAMGMGPAFAPQVAEALTSGKRPSVVYLHNAECTGCTEAFLRSTGEDQESNLDVLLFDTISLEYQETIMAAAGDAAERALEAAVNSPDGFICIVEGAIPTADNGNFGKVADHTMASISERVLSKAKAVIAYGTCAAYGGVQAAAPNPTGAKGVNAFMKGKNSAAGTPVQAINIPGCPPNPLNLVGTIVYYLQKGAIPELDDVGRPTMFFGQSVHDQCERLKHFEAGEFAESFDSEEARKGWCLYQLGCKGPQTYNNCPKILFNGVNWPVRAGHPCIGCSEPNFWDQMAPFYDS